MRSYRVKDRHETVENEKCPRCLEMFKHFMDLGDGLFACYKCGSVFVGKETRDYNYFRIKEQLELQKKEVAVVLEEEVEPLVDNFTCVCKFKAKSAAGLSAHKRRCETWKTFEQKQSSTLKQKTCHCNQ